MMLCEVDRSFDGSHVASFSLRMVLSDMSISSVSCSSLLSSFPIWNIPNNMRHVVLVAMKSLSHSSRRFQRLSLVGLHGFLDSGNVDIVSVE